MSHEELSNYSSRELLRQTINMLEDQKRELVEHRKESYLFRETTSAQLSKIASESDTFKEKQSDHAKDIKELKKTKDEQSGALKILSIIGFGFIIDLVRRLIQ